jgi:AraC family transcriptional activator of tynA and feaB
MLNLEGWRAVFSSHCFQWHLESAKPKVFSGWVQPRSIFGFVAADVSFNSNRIERTHRYTRADGVEHHAALVILAGRSTLIQNDQTVSLGVGDIAFVDATRPVTCNLSDNRPGEWLCVQSHADR